MKLTRFLIAVSMLIALISSCKKEEVEQKITENIIEGSITTNTTWEAGGNLIIRGDVYIDNASLTIQPGTTIKFEAGASLSIGYYGAASITANGTVEKPIIFTSTADSPTLGAWKGIYLYSNCSSNSSFKYCQIKYAGTNDNGSLNIDGTSCIFSNNTIQYAKKYGIYLQDVDSYFGEMNSNTISDCGGHAIRISAAKLHTIGTGNTITCADTYGVNVYGSSVTGTITWRKLTVPYYVEGEILVDNATLTIEPGTTLKFGASSQMSIGYYNTATLIANGSSTNNIVFTSSASSPTAGAWDGLYFYSNNQQNSSMTYCEVAYAGKTNDQAISISGTKLTFSNNNVHHSNGVGINLFDDGSFVAMNNNRINNCVSHVIEISCKYFHTLGTSNDLTSSVGFGIKLNVGSIELVTSWRKHSAPVYIYDAIGVDNTLTIEAGSIFKFGANGYIWVGYNSTAQLNAIGTSTNPIIFTGSSATPAAGAWAGITFFSNTSTNTVLDFCEIHYAGKGTNTDRAAVYLDDVIGMTIKNTKFINSNGFGIFKYNSSLSSGSTGNTFTNCALGNVGIN